jgi:hypothetical protein
MQKQYRNVCSVMWLTSAVKLLRDLASTTVLFLSLSVLPSFCMIYSLLDANQRFSWKLGVVFSNCSLTLSEKPGCSLLQDELIPSAYWNLSSMTQFFSLILKLWLIFRTNRWKIYFVISPPPQVTVIMAHCNGVHHFADAFCLLYWFAGFGYSCESWSVPILIFLRNNVFVHVGYVQGISVM